MTRKERLKRQRAHWEHRLQREGLTMSKGHRPEELLTLDTGDPEKNPAFSSQGLVSSVYALAAPSPYFTDEERALRAKNALKALVRKRGKLAVLSSLRAANVTPSELPGLSALEHLCQSLAE